MKIKHRISLNSRIDDKFYRFINKIGIKYKSVEMPGGKSQFIYFDITESDPLWLEIAPMIPTSKVVDVYDTYFTKNEVLSAEWARLVSSYIEGYPEPFETWVTSPINYINNCRECGTFQQASNFQIKREPALRGNDFMTLNWAVSAFFCTPQVISVFNSHQIKGYEPWKVILTKTESESKKIYQLFVPNETAPGLLEVSDLASEICPKCNITRYSHHLRGEMLYKRESIDLGLDIVRSKEWFGAMRDAYQEILVSNRVIKLVIKNGWKGIRFKVVKLI